MARSDLIKRLFASFSRGDRRAFLAAANELIDDERKKHHSALAKELKAVLGGEAKDVATIVPMQSLPKDNDRGVPLVDVVSPARYLDDLVLQPILRKDLDRVCVEARMSEVLEASGLRPCSRLLFCGPPGCGKSAAAEALANALSLPLLYVRFDAIVSSLLGETASNLRKVLDFASTGQWVILFDEFDAIGRSRDDSSEHGELKRVVNAFLQMLDRFSGRSIVIAATNFERSLDPALWRRFDEIMRFELPRIEDISLLILKRTVGWVSEKFDVDSLIPTLQGASHAEIERVCGDAKKAAAIAGKRVITQHEWNEALARHSQRRRITFTHGANEVYVDRD